MGNEHTTDAALTVDSSGHLNSMLKDIAQQIDDDYKDENKICPDNTEEFLDINECDIIEDVLKLDNRGYDILLFENIHNLQELNLLCTECGNVCVDPASLDCIQHKNDSQNDDDLDDLYCHLCLTELIKQNDGKCPISQHKQPIVRKNKRTKKLILTQNAICPYSQ
eukprot:446515_1